MKKEEIAKEMTQRHHAFFAAMQEMSDVDFVLNPEGKWTPGQHLKHLYTSVKALGQARKVPNLVIQNLYGKAKKPSQSYQGLVDRYLKKISEGGQATGRFIPDEVPCSQKEGILQKFEIELTKLNTWTLKFSEEQLDKLQLPHPLLGKVTIREMLFFTLHHVSHHQEIIARDLALAKT